MWRAGLRVELGRDLSGGFALEAAWNLFSSSFNVLVIFWIFPFFDFAFFRFVYYFSVFAFLYAFLRVFCSSFFF